MPQTGLLRSLQGIHDLIGGGEASGYGRRMMMVEQGRTGLLPARDGPAQADADLDGVVAVAMGDAAGAGVQGEHLGILDSLESVFMG
jgi:hypothetical protein